jgi:zinc transport system ATP-binding protein
MAAGPLALQVEHLAVRFGNRYVLRDLTFSVPRGATVVVIGPNGSGKTVLFKALIGTQPHEGLVAWPSGGRLGYVPQKLDLERDLPITAGDLLRAKASLYHGPRETLGRALSLVGLPETLARQTIGTLSGGQFQRLLLAFAMMGRPDVLLCDEATAGVDEAGEQNLLGVLHRLRETEGLTLLLISHDLSLIDSRVDQVLCLGIGGRTWMGPPERVMTPERLREAYDAPLSIHRHDRHGD